MCVQDPLRYDVNITAEIPNEQIAMFQVCCVVFNKYLQNTTTIKSSDFDINSADSTATEPSRSFTEEVPAQQTMQNAESERFLEKMIRLSAKLLSRDQDRIDYEEQITDILQIFINSFDSALKLITFGSSAYGFGGSTPNFNILIDAGNCNVAWFLNSLHLIEDLYLQQNH